MRQRVFFFALPAMLLSLGAWTCGPDSDSSPVSNDGDGGIDGAIDRTYPYVVPDAACEIILDDPPLLPATHVGFDVPIEYDSNPPSSGPHDAVWAAFQEYSTPVPRRNYVHDLEHGAIVFTYRCDGAVGDAGACSDVTELFHSVVKGLPDDPVCDGEGVRVRTVITPDPLLDVPIAASAWGFTYRARCIDEASLAAFAREHYGKGPEILCGKGQDHF